MHSKLTIKTYLTPFSSVSVADFEQINIRWGDTYSTWTDLQETAFIIFPSIMD